jgi:hypothetical protein
VHRNLFETPPAVMNLFPGSNIERFCPSWDNCEEVTETCPLVRVVRILAQDLHHQAALRDAARSIPLGEMTPSAWIFAPATGIAPITGNAAPASKGAVREAWVTAENHPSGGRNDPITWIS